MGDEGESVSEQEEMITQRAKLMQGRLMHMESATQVSTSDATSYSKEILDLRNLQHKSVMLLGIRKRHWTSIIMRMKQ